MRLIDADALEKTIAEEFHGISATWFIYFMRDKTPIEVYNRVRDLIDNATTIKQEGEWLHPYTTDIACECSNCHRQMPITDYYNFCPNCGAYMKGKDDE